MMSVYYLFWCLIMINTIKLLLFGVNSGFYQMKLLFFISTLKLWSFLEEEIIKSVHLIRIWAPECDYHRWNQAAAIFKLFHHQSASHHHLCVCVCVRSITFRHGSMWHSKYRFHISDSRSPKSSGSAHDMGKQTPCMCVCVFLRLKQRALLHPRHLPLLAN